MTLLPDQFHIKNDADGKAFIKVLRKVLRPHEKIVRIRGRGPRRGIRGFQNELPHGLSTSFKVYILDKPISVDQFHSQLYLKD